MWFSELAIMRFLHAWMVVWMGLVRLLLVRWCMILCARGRGSTWWEPFHRPVPRTLEEHHFITSKGLSLDLACHMYPCGLMNLPSCVSTCLNGRLNWLSCMMSDYYWYFSAFSRLLVHDSVCNRSGQYMMRTISQTCSENTWGTSFYNI